MRKRYSKLLGFSLVELVIVIVILGVIAAIAIPRISSGSRNAGEAALKANLATLRNAIDWYYGEHHSTFPGVKTAGSSYGTAKSQEAFKNQLLYYSNAIGEISEDLDQAFPNGPYVRGSFPDMPVGANAGKNNVKIVDKAGPLKDSDTDNTSGWIYNPTTGEIIANCPTTEVGTNGIPYNEF